MVPDSFHDFFLGATSIAGALIGLLFVAISVQPAAVTGKAEHVEHRIRAAAAMSAFLDALVVSLLALIPGIDLGPGASVLGVVGAVSTVALMVALVAQTRQSGGLHARRLRSLMWLLALLVVYGYQLYDGLRLNDQRGDTGLLTNQAVLIVVLFVIGISRAWELVGARPPRLMSSLREAGESQQQHGSAPQARPDENVAG